MFGNVLLPGYNLKKQKSFCLLKDLE